MYDCKIIDRSAVCGCRLSAALNGDRTAPFYGAAVKAPGGREPSGGADLCLQGHLCTDAQKWVMTCCSLVLNALYEGEAYAFNALQITLW